MKRYLLIQIIDYIKDFKKISAVERVEDTIIKVSFLKGEVLFFDMKRGDPYIFKKEEYKKVKNYNAPFDVVLKKRLVNSRIDSVEVLEGNRIVRFFCESSSKYKAQKTILQFEFTGRNTNVIILDEEMSVLEAFRHIDRSVSFREVKVGETLVYLPPREFKENVEKIEDIEKFLHEEFLKREKNRLIAVKNQKQLLIQKKLDKLYTILNGLDEASELLEKSLKYQEYGNLILSNIYKIENYQKEVTLYSFEGEEVTIELPQNSTTPSSAANQFFKYSKKLKQKAKYTHIEKENILSKIKFLQNLFEIIKKSKSIDEVNLYLPKQTQSKKSRLKEDSNVETFYIEGYKIVLGKNERGNISVLNTAKANDTWIHLKDLPSTHVIIKSDKKNIPDNVLEFGAKLCVEFSCEHSGVYEVDYTKRRNVKIREGANVNYAEYKTLKAAKE